MTDKGIQAAKETTQVGVRMECQSAANGSAYQPDVWTLGQHDQVCIFDAPNDETAASVLLAANMLGNIRTHTMRAFTTSEMEKILSKGP